MLDSIFSMPVCLMQNLTNKVYRALEATPEHGAEFAAAVRHLMSVENSWTTWKHANCPTDKLMVPPAMPPCNWEAQSGTVFAICWQCHALYQ